MSVTELQEPDDLESEHAPAQSFGDYDETQVQTKGELMLPSPSRSGNGARPRASALENLGLAVTLTGIVLLLFAGYLLGWSDLQAAHNQRRLLTTFGSGTCTKYAPTCAAEYAAFDQRAPADGKAAAVLEIPAIGLRDVVVEGTTATDLQQGPGLMPATSFPGSAGEAVIAGRKLTYGGPFASINQMRPGDQISVVDFLGSFQYAVTRQFVVPAGQTLPVLHSNLGLLALVTSNQSVPPSGFYVVEARLTGDPVKAPTSPPRPAVASELGLGGDSSALVGLLGWGGALVLLLVGTVIAYRRTGRTLLVYVLSTPVLLPVAMFTFENAARLLPATM
jgi:sortase A